MSYPQILLMQSDKKKICGKRCYYKISSTQLRICPTLYFAIRKNKNCQIFMQTFLLENTVKKVIGINVFVTRMLLGNTQEIAHPNSMESIRLMEMLLHIKIILNWNVN